MAASANLNADDTTVAAIMAVAAGISTATDVSFGVATVGEESEIAGERFGIADENAGVDENVGADQNAGVDDKAGEANAPGEELIEAGDNAAAGENVAANQTIAADTGTSLTRARLNSTRTSGRGAGRPKGSSNVPLHMPTDAGRYYGFFSTQDWRRACFPSHLERSV